MAVSSYRYDPVTSTAFVLVGPRSSFSKWSAVGHYDVMKFYALIDGLTYVAQGDSVALATYCDGYGGA